MAETEKLKLKIDDNFMMFPLKIQFKLLRLDAVPYEGPPELGFSWPEITKEGLKVCLTHEEAQMVYEWLLDNYEIKRRL